ncbi:hypothetical protein L596_024568 [Steinernema carpocapsae]|uniref:Peptidase S1 domain-containing protein n=1 Tax=Steinernema carpocapsae TaxID=34508 RepID=A0A4U5MH57_STECR|nr:hypothetical protein L596_024568 [Steinernema carpocapsae]
MTAFLLWTALLLTAILGSPLTKFPSSYDFDNCGLQQTKINYTKLKEQGLRDDAISDDGGGGGDYDVENGVFSNENFTTQNPNKPITARIILGDLNGIRRKAMGGTIVREGEHPWAVALIYEGVYRCAGTLISKKHVITAAHCFTGDHRNFCDSYLAQEEVIKKLEIHYGGTCVVPNDLDCEEDDYGEHNEMKSVKVVRAQYKEFFRPWNCSNGRDIALLELEKEINVTHICLPHLHNDPGFRNMNIFFSFGWGSDPIQKKQVHPTLQKVEHASILKKSYCKQQYNNLPFDVVCTKEYQNKDMCSGDSGGGFVTHDIHDPPHYFIQALVSFGTNCTNLLNGERAKTQVFTDITYHTATIDKFIFGDQVHNATKMMLKDWW